MEIFEKKSLKIVEKLMKNWWKKVEKLLKMDKKNKNWEKSGKFSWKNQTEKVSEIIGGSDF